MSLLSRHSEQASKIMHAAAQLFARQGYHGSSTKEIARLADVSENTLFRYFEHKEDLFWAALDSRLADLKLQKRVLDAMEEGAPPEVVLPQILVQVVDTTILRPELLRLVAVAFLEHRHKASNFCGEHLAPVISAVNRYLARNMESGRIRNLDPMMMTAALAITAVVHPEISKLINGAPPYSNSRQAVVAYTRFWLDILLATSLPRKGPHELMMTMPLDPANETA